VTVFGLDGAVLASRGIDGRPHGIAATAKAFVLFDPLARAAFRVLSDSLADGLEVPLIADFDVGGEPMEQLRRAEGLVDGVAAGYVLVTMYAGMILVYDSEGRLTAARRTIDGPALSEVARALDTEMTEGVAFSMLVNGTLTEVHVISTAQADPFLVDVYRWDDARYSHSFEIPHPECGPRYVGERVIVSGCADEPVLRTVYRVVSGD
jgi:hypothetical protein